METWQQSRLEGERVEHTMSTGQENGDVEETVGLTARS